MSVIYILNWTNNDYFYVGQAQNFTRRVNVHKSKLNTCKHSNPKLQNVFNKYGEPQFHIIEECEIEELNEREQFYLDLLFNDPNCLNLAKFVQAFRRGTHLTKETKQKLREHNLGKKMSDEAKAKIAKAHKGKWYSPRKTGASHHGARAVLQFDLDGRFIKRWETISLAAKETSTSEALIIRNCKQKCSRAKNYVWRYEHEGR